MIVVFASNYVDYLTTQTGSRIPVTSKMETVCDIFDHFHSLTVVTKISSILDGAGVLNPTLIAHIFSSCEGNFAQRPKCRELKGGN